MNPYIAHIMIGSKTILRLGIILCSVILLSHQDARATHIVGGHITYRCLGPDVNGVNQYEIRLSLRRDCFLGASDAQFDDPASIGFFDATTNQPLAFVGFGGEFLMDLNDDDTLNQIFISDCAIAGNPVCVHQTTYVDTISLPFWANGYVIAYQRCCRNGSVLNMANPISTGMTIVTEMSGAAQAVCKSSPQIGDYPPIYICVNKDIHYFPNAVDFEGDSLGFEIATPYAGGDLINNRPQPPPPPPYDLINWRPPYSLDNIMGGVPLAINPITGEVTGTPNTVGQFVITIAVTSYRDGVELAKTRVDFQYNVRDCHDVPVAQFTAEELNCESLTVNFIDQSLFSDQHLWIFDYGNPNSDFSLDQNPIYTYPDDGFYQVALITNDSDLICFDTVVHTVGVFTSQLNAAFSYSVPSCSDNVILNMTDLSTDPLYPIVQWEWLLTYPNGILPSSEQHPTFDLDVDGPSTVFVVLIVTDINGCTASQTQSFQVQDFGVDFSPDADSICNGESVHLLVGGNPDLTYTWSPPNGIDTTVPWDPIAYPGLSTNYYVTVTDGLCVVTDSTHVGVQQLPDLEFSYDTDCKTLLASFDNNSTGILYHWNFGDPSTLADTSNQENSQYEFPQPGEYIVTLSSRDGCDVSTTDTVTVNTIAETLDNTTTNCFQTSIELNPVQEGDYTYVWSPPGFLNDPNSPNPIATVNNDTWFYVTITEASLPDCHIVDSIEVLIPDDFEIIAPGDTTTCSLATINLTAEIEGNNNLDVVWTDMNGGPLGTGLVLPVSPEITASYIVTATDTLGCSKSDTAIIFRPDPTFAITASNDTSYCNVQSITLCASSLAGITFEWYNEDNLLVGDENCVLATPGDPSCFFVFGTDPLGCQVKDTVCLTPVFFDLDITGDQGQCLGLPVTIGVTDHNGQNLSYHWSPTGDTTSSITVSPSITTTYTVLVTNDDLGCETTLTSTLEVFVFDPLEIIIDANPDTIILTDPTQLTVNQNPGFDYVWASFPPGDPIDPVYNPIVYPTDTTTYVVTVTDDNGCTGTASRTVIVLNPFCDERDIFLPNAFTPNNDGKNDELLLYGNFIESMELHIYSRWGEQVFSTTSQLIGWDGTYKGELLPPDVFGYYLSVVCPNEATYQKKGNITLLH